ncbi:hypothetical protein MPDQ_002603 [Monascus purpureus]|uniref:Uncharacterized protein n=1 Tax=Monascus purpureus TaxID=5098 RepID=A0A507QPD8_MONPU|nr:hypothetical protein MPDQ_002603 [Monascus purpureus]
MLATAETSIPSGMEQLRHLIQTHPLIDNHAHNLLSAERATDYLKYPFESITSEAGSVALQNARKTLPHLRAANQLADLYRCPSDWDEIKAARHQLVQNDYELLIRQCLEGTHTLLLDDLLAVEDVEPFHWHDKFTASETKRIVRIETMAAQVLESMSRSGDRAQEVSQVDRSAFARFSSQFTDALASAIKDLVVVGFKSVICYRTGLEIDKLCDLHELNKSCFRMLLQQPGSTAFRIEDKPLNDWIVLRTLEMLSEARRESGISKPLQLHTGLGDSDIDLVRSNPAYLQPVIAKYPEVDFVLLHSSYPYTRQAGYLACVYPNVYLDLGEVFPMVSRDAQERIVLVDYVTKGDYSIDQAMEAAADILFYNSNKLYGLGQPPLYNSKSSAGRFLAESKGTHAAVSALRPASQPASLLDRFVQSNPDVKFIWVQWLDYTTTTRARLFPIGEFEKLARGQRRLGISMSTPGLLQDDSCVAGTATGQFQLSPDLSSLYRNVGRNSKSATVMARWLSEDGNPLEGCPRATLEGIVSKLNVKYGIGILCGFEIEVVLLKPVPSNHTREIVDYLPFTTKHSWCQVTPEIRNKSMPILEEIVETLSDIGIDIEQFHAESAPSQFEFVLPPSPSLRAIDTLLKARQIIVDVAEFHGLRATLHPRPYPSALGTAAHAHISTTPATHERSFLAGILSHLPSILAFTLPQDASYNRVKPGIWAGGEWVAWGTQNRETPIRKIAPGHWEMKAVDGLCNMYLGMSALFAAGYLGLEENLDLTLLNCEVDPAVLSPAQRSTFGITTPLPKNLNQSLSALEADQDLGDILGKSFVKTYIAVKRAEKEKLDGMDEEERRIWLVERY